MLQIFVMKASQVGNVVRRWLGDFVQIVALVALQEKITRAVGLPSGLYLLQYAKKDKKQDLALGHIANK
ncbi:MAG: hypothetical protein ACFB11_10380 [Paracoccaceae bacterium]